MSDLMAGAVPKAFCVFEYQYRDASNYKVHGEILLQGAFCPDVEQRIVERCTFTNGFVAEQLGIPVLYEDLYALTDGPTEDDLTTHEFMRLRSAEKKDPEALKVWGSVDELAARFDAVKSWDHTLSPHA